MHTEWNLIKQWNNLDDNKKLTATLALVILSLVSVILYYETKINRIDFDYKKELRDNDKEKDLILKNHIFYIQRSEREYRDIFIEIQKLKMKEL